jgi:glycosyltransferase involved in cell wall biosynthesis
VTLIRPAFVRRSLVDYASIFFTHWIEISRQIDDFHPDVIVCFGILDALTGMHLGRAHRVPVVYYLIDELHQLVPQRAMRGLAKLLESYNLRTARATLVTNIGLRDYALRLGAAEHSTVVMPLGVDLRRYDPVLSGRGLRSELGFAERDLVLFFMGWMYPFSGLMEVAQDVLQLGEESSSVKLLLVGQGELWDGLEALQRRGPHSERIVLKGWQPFSEMPRYIAASDACLLPAQRHEAMMSIVPIKILEYMAAAKPVIATRLPGLVREFGEDHGLAFVDGPEQVLPKVLELAREGKLTRIGQQGRAFVQKYDWNVVTDGFESYLKSLANNRVIPP